MPRFGKVLDPRGIYDGSAARVILFSRSFRSIPTESRLFFRVQATHWEPLGTLSLPFDPPPITMQSITMQSTQVHPGLVCKKPLRPFISSHYHSAERVDDGIFRVVLIISGSVASIKAPDIVGALVKVNNNALDILPSNLPSNGPPADRFRCPH